MKRLIIIAVLILAALTMRAQAPADSVSVMLRHLANTNREIISLNRAYNVHAVMVAGGGALTAAGLIYAAILEKSPVYGVEPTMSQDHIRTGLHIAAVGAAVIVASIVTMPKRVHLDANGLVVDIDKGKRRK